MNLNVMAIASVLTAIGYPFIKYWVQRSNDRTDEILREDYGLHVPAPRRRKAQQYVPPARQPHVPGFRGPLEGKFWGNFLP